MSLWGIIVKPVCRGMSEMSCESKVELYVGAGDGMLSKSIEFMFGGDIFLWGRQAG
jgi:hypothetical protein